MKAVLDQPVSSISTCQYPLCRSKVEKILGTSQGVQAFLYAWQWVSIFDCYLVYLPIIHTPSNPFVLFANQHYRGYPITPVSNISCRCFSSSAWNPRGLWRTGCLTGRELPVSMWCLTVQNQPISVGPLENTSWYSISSSVNCSPSPVSNYLLFQPFHVGGHICFSSMAGSSTYLQGLLVGLLQKAASGSTSTCLPR